MGYAASLQHILVDTPAPAIRGRGDRQQRRRNLRPRGAPQQKVQDTGASPTHRAACLRHERCLLQLQHSMAINMTRSGPETTLGWVGRHQCAHFQEMLSLGNRGPLMGNAAAAAASIQGDSNNLKSPS